MNKKGIIVSVVVLVVLIAIIFIARGSDNDESPAPVTSAPSETTNPATTTRMSMYTLADIAKHAVKSDCWTTVNGGVYNLTSFVPNHPGGERILVVCGKDGTSAFEGQHGGQRDPAKELASLKIGELAK